MFSKIWTKNSTKSYSDKLAQVSTLLNDAEAVVIGAGAGLSASAGLLYSGERFERLFTDFIAKYKLTDMYSAAFYPHKSLEEHWGYWSYHIYHNRYAAELNSTYSDLLKLVQDKNYFVITTNGDHLFLKNGFDKQRVFYTQGDYGLFQCTVPCHKQTYDNHDIIMKMISEQKDLKIPSELIPYCPKCDAPMTVNLRMDNTFVEDDGWHRACARYTDFIETHMSKKVLFLDLGIGLNTPSIIKYPFWKFTYQNKLANHVSINTEIFEVPKEIEKQSISIIHDIGDTIRQINL